MGGGTCPPSTPQTAYAYNLILNSFSLYRSKTVKGSTKELPQWIRLQGVLSSSSEVNPHLHDANAVYIHYCDGGTIADARDDPVFVKTAKDKDTQAEPAKFLISTPPAWTMSILSCTVYIGSDARVMRAVIRLLPTEKPATWTPTGGRTPLQRGASSICAATSF